MSKTKKEKIKSTELLLLLLYLNNQKTIYTHIKFQKMVFLFEEELKKKHAFDNLEINLFNFTAYHYGPYSDRLKKDLDFLNSYGFIEVQNNDMEINDELEEEEVESKNYFTYKITSLGKEFVEQKVKNKFTPEQLEALENLKKGINKITQDELLSYVYRNYPNMIENSKIRDKYV